MSVSPGLCGEFNVCAFTKVTISTSAVTLKRTERDCLVPGLPSSAASPYRQGSEAQAVDKQWTSSGQAVDKAVRHKQWTSSGQAVDKAVDKQWTRQ